MREIQKDRQRERKREGGNAAYDQIFWQLFKTFENVKKMEKKKFGTKSMKA